MAPRRDKIQLEVEINGKKAGRTFKELRNDARNLARELDKLEPGTDAFVRKAAELKKVNTQLAGIRQQTKGVSKGMNELRTSAGAALRPLIAFFAIDRVVDWTRALFNAGVQQDALARKAQTVLGQTLDQVTASAEEHAKAMGLTTEEYISAAAAAADLLIPMGFQREEAAEISTELVNLSGALSEWTGGQRTAQEVSEILNKALLGEREQLKTLGISISEADVKQRLLDKGLQDLTGTMLQQAKAAATLELITEKSADAQAAFATNTDSAIRRQAELSAELKEIGQTLSRLLLPVFERLIGVASRVTDFIGRLAEKFERLVDPAAALTREYNEQAQSVASLEDELIPLLERYEQLRTKTQPTAAEQEELRSVIQRIGEITPTAIEQIDEYGNILAVNAAKSREFLEAERARLRFVNQEAIGALEKQIERFEALRLELQRQIEVGEIYEQGVNQMITRVLSPEQLQDRVNRLKELTQQIAGARAELERLTGDNLQGPTVEPAGTTDTATGGDPGNPLGANYYENLFKKRLEDLEEGLEREQLLIEQSHLLGNIDELERRNQETDAERSFLRSKLELLESFNMEQSNLYLQTTNELLTLEQDRSDQLLLALETYMPQHLGLHQDIADRVVEIYSQANDNIQADSDATQEQINKNLSGTLQLYSDYVGDLIGFLEQEEGQREGLAKRAKQREIAAVSLAGSAEVAQIWANSQQSFAARAFGPAAGVAIAIFQTALAVARTRQRIQEIQAQQFASGGKVLPHFTGQRITGQNIAELDNGDNVFATLRTDEVVLNKAQQQKLGGDATFRAIGVPGFETGGRVTVNTTPIVNDIDLNSAGAAPSDSGMVLQELRALRMIVATWPTEIRAYLKYQDIEDAEATLAEIQAQANL